MWSRAAFLTGLLAVAACGFTPAYGPGGPAEVLRGRVSVDAPQSVIGFQVRDALIDRLGPAEVAAYILKIDVELSLDTAAINTDGETTRFSTLGRANWTLTEGGSQIAEGEARGFTGYDATGSTVATQTAAADARRRLAIILADDIVADLLSAVIP